VTKQACCDNKLMLGTHAVESQSGQVTTASFVKAKFGPVSMPPAPGENLRTGHDLPSLR
jgi:hypothetical protein